MRVRRHSSLTLTVFVCYALSLTASGWFHDHRHGPPSEPWHSCVAHATCHAAAGQCAAGLECRDHAGATARSGGGESDWTEGGECLVCQFLSQRTLDDGCTIEIASGMHVERLHSLTPLPVVCRLIACCHIRAPPCAA